MIFRENPYIQRSDGVPLGLFHFAVWQQDRERPCVLFTWFSRTGCNASIEQGRPAYCPISYGVSTSLSMKASVVNTSLRNQLGKYHLEGHDGATAYIGHANPTLFGSPEPQRIPVGYFERANSADTALLNPSAIQAFFSKPGKRVKNAAFGTQKLVGSGRTGLSDYFSGTGQSITREV